MAAAAKPEIRAFFDGPTNTVSYLVWDSATKEGVVIDPVLNFDHRSGDVTVESADGVLAEAKKLGVKIKQVLETHAHADHLSGAPYIKLKTGATVAIGEHIKDVQKIFRPVFNALDVSGDGSEFDHLFKDGEHFKVGTIDAEVIYTPGHTPACVSYKIGDAVFVGDTMFMPDYGTARADFPGGNARELYRSIRRILSLPKETRLFMCHDYKAPGRDQYAWETTVGEEKARNVHVHEGVSEDDFVKMREARDATLTTPLLLLPSIQVNIRAGKFPPAEANGVRYLKVPVKNAP
ncbi:MAG: MBL fold metallo-hydrolase [Sphingobacteriales bacterium]|jgi:glyoxylase-like metal-dependent hydrolase (beta-lactamase superfamily II)